MSNLAVAEQLFAELGPILDPQSIVHFPESSSWSISVDADTQVTAALESGQNTLVFALDLGPLPEENLKEAYELLLRFGYIWQTNGGLSAAINAEGRGALIYKHPVTGLDVQRLQTLLRNLSVHRQKWSNLFNYISSKGDGGQLELPETRDGNQFV